MNTNIHDLISAIKLKDANLALSIANNIKDAISAGDIGAINSIVEPANITEIHSALIEHLAVPHRLLIMKRRAMTKTTKAYIFATIIINAITRVSK